MRRLEPARKGEKMLGKVITGFIVVAISSGLIYGAVNRTVQSEVVEESLPLTELAGDGYRGGPEGEAGSENVIEPGESYRGEIDEAPGSEYNSEFGNGYQGGQDGGSGTGLSDGSGLAEDASSWVELTGTVTTVEADLLQVKVTDGSLIELSRRAWWFAIDQGFTVEIGDQVELTGFFEGDEFETAMLSNLTKSSSVAIRDENGRPLWAGRGR
jgi:hypothetical protein